MRSEDYKFDVGLIWRKLDRIFKARELLKNEFFIDMMDFSCFYDTRQILLITDYSKSFKDIIDNFKNYHPMIKINAYFHLMKIVDKFNRAGFVFGELTPSNIYINK